MMTKAVVLEIKGNYAAVLADDGTVRKIRNAGYAVGQEIEFAAGARRSATMVRAAVAAAAILLAGGSGLYYASDTVFAYSTVTVSADDAEVELTLNRRDEVISAKALNDASEKAAEDLQVSKRKRKPLAEALTELTAEKETVEIDSVTSADEQRETALLESARKMLPERKPAEPKMEKEAIPQYDNKPAEQTSEPDMPDMPDMSESVPDKSGEPGTGRTDTMNTVRDEAAPRMQEENNEKTDSQDVPDAEKMTGHMEGSRDENLPDTEHTGEEPPIPDTADQEGQIPEAAPDIMAREQYEQAGLEPEAAPDMAREQYGQSGSGPEAGPGGGFDAR